MINRFVLVFVGLLIIWSCSPSPRYTVKGKPSIKLPRKGEKIPSEKPPEGKIFKGIASFYGYRDGFHGKKTANGETYDMNGLTAAHKTWVFNTYVEVKNLSNGRTVIVRINDRGPYIEGRIIDLSYGAAKELHMIEAGVQEVEITILR